MSVCGRLALWGGFGLGGLGLVREVGSGGVGGRGYFGLGDHRQQSLVSIASSVVKSAFIDACNTRIRKTLPMICVYDMTHADTLRSSSPCKYPFPYL